MEIHHNTSHKVHCSYVVGSCSLLWLKHVVFRLYVSVKIDLIPTATLTFTVDIGVFYPDSGAAQTCIGPSGSGSSSEIDTVTDGSRWISYLETVPHCSTKMDTGTDPFYDTNADPKHRNCSVLYDTRPLFDCVGPALCLLLIKFCIGSVLIY